MTHPIKGSGESCYKLDSRKSMTMKEVLFVPRLKKYLLSIYFQQKKVGITLLPRVYLYVKAESNSKVF